MSLFASGLASLDKIVSRNPLAQAAGSAGASILGVGNKPSVSDQQYDDLVHYFRYSSTAYAIIIPGPDLLPLSPNGAKLVLKLFDLLTDTHGYIARDDKRKEIVVAFRGSVSPANFITDFAAALVDWETKTPSVPAPAGVKVHFGFQAAWRTVAETAMAGVTAEAALYPDYSIVVCGHSLGGALAVIASTTIQATFPTRSVRLYTYGQPRTGNAAFATWVNSLIDGPRSFRVVHSNDGVPTMVPEMFGFAHQGTEYWALSPHSPAATRICVEPGQLEDPKGSKKIFPSTGINPAHLMYFGIFYMTPFLI